MPFERKTGWLTNSDLFAYSGAMTATEKSTITQQVEMAKTLAIVINDLREEGELLDANFLLEMLSIAGLKLQADNETLDAVAAFEFSSNFGV